ncbi:MAG: hypothetical protein PHU93_03050 [Candidatus Gracilibacteria bacterium]|nr:hypothetical protein [Candidatus Gracilibacteria bacterium]
MSSANIAYIILIILGLLIVYSLFSNLPKKLSTSKKAYFRSVLNNATSKELHAALISCDTVLEHILRELGNEGTLGEMLQKKKKLKNIELFWKYHKLRNKAVHEIVPPKITTTDVALFERAIVEEFLG